MPTRSTKAILMCGGSVGLVLATMLTASAEQADNDALLVTQAKISLAEAVAIAEMKTGGRASKVEFEKAAKGWVFDVETVTEKMVQDVHINAQTGAVMSVADDAIDRDDEEDGEGGEAD